MDTPFRLTIHLAGQPPTPCELPEGSFTIAVAMALHCACARDRMAAQHARLVLHATGGTIEDLGSPHGTLINGIRSAAPVALVPGLKITIGPLPVEVVRVPAPLPEPVRQMSPQSRCHRRLQRHLRPPLRPPPAPARNGNSATPATTIRKLSCAARSKNQIHR